MLEFFSGMSGSVNSKRAASECVDIAFAGEALEADLVVFHTTMGHVFEDIVGELRGTFPRAQIVGCTCAGVVGKEGTNETMKGLSLMAVRGPDTEWSVASVDDIRGFDSFEKSKSMAQQLQAQASNINMVMFIASGIDIAADRAIEGIGSVLGADIPVFGGTSSDNMKAVSTFQFVDGKTFERGAFMVGFADPTLRVEMGVHHGSVPVGAPFEVTKAEANRVYELNGQPAWPALMERLGKEPDTHPGPMIPIAGIGVPLPDELQRAYDNPQILRVIVKTEDDGSFYMPVDVTVGEKFSLTERNEDLIFDGLQRMIEDLTRRLDGKTPVAVFHTDCAARGRALFGRVLKDEIVQRMQAPVCQEETVPWLGMYGFGEFTRLAGRNFFHNYTTSLYCIIRD
ncbi:MAG: FIST N-terminal domain-containing protein [Myxococcota bacterium]